MSQTWKEQKQALLAGLPANKVAIVEKVLDNQINYFKAQGGQLNETAGSDVVSTGNIGNFQKILLPMVRRVIPNTIATEVVGVQPMSGPTGLVFSMRFVYKNTATTTETPDGDIAVDNEVFGNTSNTAPYASKMRRFYSGGIADPGAAGAGVPYAATTGVNVGGAYTAGASFSLSSSPLSGNGANVIDQESFPGRALGLHVLRQSVEAKTRKLQAKLSLEAMQDMSSQHGLDLEAEMVQALSAEIVHEIDNEIVTDLIKLAGTTETFDMSGAFTGTPHYVGDRHAVLGVLINKVANEIAAKTRRGAGNFVIASPQAVSMLQSAAKSVFAPAVSGSFEGPNNTRLVGTLNGTIKVYSFLFNASFGTVAAASSVPGGATSSSDVLLVGYKGGNGETDTGYFYCPYIPLMTASHATDPSTYNQHTMVMTRYGKATFTASATSLANSADYYGKIVMNNIVFM